MVKGCEETDLHINNLYDIGHDYARTLNIWRENFLQNWEQINELGFDEVFKRKWLYYLQYCEAAFETRNISDVHLTLIKPNNTTYKHRGDIMNQYNIQMVSKLTGISIHTLRPGKKGTRP